MAKGFGSILAAIVAAAVAAVLCDRHALGQQSSNVATMTGFSIPEVDDSGQLKWKVIGESARLNPTGGPVDITQVRMEMYKDSRVDMVLTSPQCFFDRDKRQAETEAPVQITGKNIIITGDGFFWSGSDNLLVIRHNAKAVVTDSKSFGKPSSDAAATNRPPPEAGK